MATIPLTTQRSVLPSDSRLPITDPDAIFNQNSLGKSLSKIGKEISKATDELSVTLQRMKEEDDRREFKKLDIEFSDYLRKVTYGDGTEENPGFLNLEGENVLGAFPSTQDAIKKRYEELKKSATNKQVREMFDLLAQERMGDTLGTFTNYTADQRRAANDAVSKARIASAVSEAATNYGSIDQIEKQLAIVLGEVTDQAGRNGWNDDVTSQVLKEQQSAVLNAAITGAIVNNVGYAQRLLNQYRGELTGTDKIDLQSKIDRQQEHLISKANAAEARAEREFNKRKEENFESLTRKLFLGELSRTELDDMVRSGQIDGTKAFAIKNYMDQLSQDKEKTGNPMATLMMRADAMSGKYDTNNMAQLFDDIVSNNLNEEEGKAVFADVEQAVKNGGLLARSDVKQGMDEIEATVGGNKDQFGIFTDQTAPERVVNAKRSYIDLIQSGTSPREAADKIIGDFRPTAQTIKTQPRPKFWPATVPWGDSGKADLMEGLKQTLADTQSRAGDLGEKEYQRQLELIQNLAEFITKLPEETQ